MPVWKRSGAGLAISEAPVPGRELRAEIDDSEGHLAAVELAGSVFGCLDQVFAESLSLMAGLYGEKAEVGTLPPDFQIDTTDDRVMQFGDEETALGETLGKLRDIDAGTTHEKRFELVGIVDQSP